jgi:hypothetical protein
MSFSAAALVSLPDGVVDRADLQAATWLESW